MAMARRAWALAGRTEWSLRTITRAPVGKPTYRSMHDASSLNKLYGAVIKVYATVVPPNYFLPWTKKPQREATGSGFMIKGNRILTNAHVVADQSLVMVRKHGDPNKYLAEVAHVAHDGDLAILHVQDKLFWEDTDYLEFGPTPSLQDRVLVAGYPTGGDTISITSGVVSRAEVQRYAHGGTNLLALQIDASINPGNSGGPVLLDDENLTSVGVAFQSLTQAESVGYVIPYPVVQHFIDDIEKHGQRTGFCEFGIRIQVLENPQVRDYYGMPKDLSGIVITAVNPLNHAGSMLKVNDILLEVDGLTVANDATVPFRNHERVLLTHVLVSRFVDDIVKVKVLRRATPDAEPEMLDLEIKLDETEPFVPFHQYDTVTSYFVHAGLVFVPLTWPFLYEWGEDWYSQGPRHLIQRAMDDYQTVDGEQPVVLSQILMDKVNYGYEGLTPCEVVKFNGERVINLAHLMEMVLACKDRFLRFELSDKNTSKVVLDREAALESNERILTTYNVPSTASPDLCNPSARQDLSH